MSSPRKSRAKKRPSKRDYKSPLREAQTARTRQMIIDALVEQVNADGHADFSVPDIAARAGVSVRTVYRHFPARDDLLEGLNEGWARITPSFKPKDARDFVESVAGVFGQFDAHADIMAAAITSRLGREAHARARSRRTRSMRRAFDELLTALPEGRGDEMYAVLRILFSSRTWHALRTEHGLDNGRAAKAVEWALGLLVDDMERQAKKKGRDR